MGECYVRDRLCDNAAGAVRARGGGRNLPCDFRRYKTTEEIHRGDPGHHFTWGEAQVWDEERQSGEGVLVGAGCTKAQKIGHRADDYLCQGMGRTLVIGIEFYVLRAEQ